MFKNFQVEIKTFVIVAVIAVIVSVAGILLLRDDARDQVLPTPSPVPTGQSPIDTSTWQTYRSDEFGFDIKYPGNWMVAKNLFAPEPCLVFCPANLATDPDPEVICTLKTGATKPQYEDGMIYLFRYDKSVSKPNNPAYRFVGLDPQGNQYYLYSVDNNELIDQILSTFRFVE